MNFILSQFNNKIAFLKSDGQRTDLRVYYQSKFEFSLLFILGYLWDKNWNLIGLDEREYVANCIMKPSIGTVVSIIRKLDLQNEFFGNKKLKQLSKFIDDYPSFRNEKIGHGYSFEDDLDNYLDFFDSYFDIIESQNINSIFSQCDLIKVLREDNNTYKGISYKADGGTYLSWSCHKEVAEFKVGDVYLCTTDNNYFRLSPFIRIESEFEFYCFCSIEEKLTGRTKFNRLLKTEFRSFEISEFERLSISTDKSKRKSANGTVINSFDNNFKKYIDVGVTKKITAFLEKNMASVFATIWGHGGVGKTASIQRVCEILCNQEKKQFDYIVFISAKDRYYNYYQGRINPLTDGISSLEDIVCKVNLILFNDYAFDPQLIYNYSGKLLIVIDDFETFTKREKGRIVSFINNLNINHHKVILTTRSATLITGEEIQTTELSEEESVQFLVEAIKNEMPTFDLSQLQKDLKYKDTRKKIFEITSGRPLFILQLGIFITQKGTLHEALSVEIKSTSEAVNFLYDRIYDYLSTDAKNMFLGISLLIDENDLTGLIENLRFILRKEDKEDEFQKSLNELIKLKIITVEDKDFFKVYSGEIQKLMRLYYQQKGTEYDGDITHRFNLINTGSGATAEIALLENADASRFAETETDVENKYRYILNRDKSPYAVKLTALLNFATYLISQKRKVEKALKLYQDYFQLFRRDFKYIEHYSACLWSGSRSKDKYQAPQIIQDFFQTKPKLDQETYLKFLGLLTMYKSILVVTERDELKAMFRTKEVSKTNYDLLYSEQKERIEEISKFPGGKLYNAIKDIDLMSLSPACRNHVLDGLTHYIEITIRNRQKTIGKRVCQKIIEEMPESYQKPFVYKLNKILFIENPEGFDNDIKNVMSQAVTSDFGHLLKSALTQGEQ